MRLGEPLQVLARAIRARVTFVRRGAESLVVLRVLPGFAGEGGKGGIDGGQDGGVESRCVEAGGDAGDVAGEAGEDVDGFLAWGAKGGCIIAGTSA
ncbi:hypothetical protein KC349_g195 [Hortaea werneckii]|nr:hypothetical protein KC349_g195 [Hortaea werneckii]